MTAFFEACVWEIEGVDDVEEVGSAVGTMVAVGDGLGVDVGVGNIVGVAVGDGVDVGVAVKVGVRVGVVVGVVVSPGARVCLVPEYALDLTLAATTSVLVHVTIIPSSESSKSRRDTIPTNTLSGVNLA